MTETTDCIPTATATRPGADTIELELEAHRKELTGYCHRLLGSGFEAEDAVQETLVKAWQGFGRFEGRAALRSWLYRIATNVCLDMLQGRQRRARPMDLGPSSTTGSALGHAAGNQTSMPSLDGLRAPRAEGDPAELVATRESIRLAFVAALRHLPPRQRAVLILREVLRWPATDVAELLGTSVASVNSALQRARTKLSSARPDDTELGRVDAQQHALLARCVDAFERYDVASLVSLLPSPRQAS